jgi:hypothetical protein
MTPGAIAERVSHIADVRATGASADLASVRRALVAVREVTSWAAAQQSGLIAQLSTLEACPELSIADAAMISTAAASRAKERSETLVRTPALTAHLERGAIVPGHADAVTRTAKQLDTVEERRELFERADRLADTAAAMTVEEFARRIRREADQIRRDDGMVRFERQKRAVRLRTWTDDEGMWNLAARFDPVLGLRLNAALAGSIEALFAESTPEFCPADPLEKQRFLAAHALARLVTGEGGVSRSGRAEYVVVIDADVPNRVGPVVDWPIPVEVPTRVLAELMTKGRVETVVVRNGVVLHAPGQLNLERTTRLANRAQRRALQALYATCAIPGCHTRYHHCKIHHIRWWRHGGTTNLDNLIPVCARHHTDIHVNDWTVTLGSRRQLTVVTPDGIIRTTGPPTRRTA